MSTKTWILCIGVVIGMAYPFALDYILFGSPTPCHSVKVYEDGSSIQHCQVRD